MATSLAKHCRLVIWWGLNWLVLLLDIGTWLRLLLPYRNIFIWYVSCLTAQKEIAFLWKPIREPLWDITLFCRQITRQRTRQRGQRNEIIHIILYLKCLYSSKYISIILQMFNFVYSKVTQNYMVSSIPKLLSESVFWLLRVGSDLSDDWAFSPVFWCFSIEPMLYLTLAVLSSLYLNWLVSICNTLLNN
jgi:hypothetical protein